MTGDARGPRPTGAAKSAGAAPTTGRPPAMTGRPPAPRTAGEMLGMARAFLERKGAPEGRLEAELLVAHSLGLDRLGLFMQLDRPVRGAEIDAARDLLVRRGRREPVAYITGKREFYGRDFRVGRGVLIPRPETEQLVDIARERARERAGALEKDRSYHVLDIGTGSGCIAVTIALEVPNACVTAVDISEKAIAYTEANAELHEVDVAVLCGDGIGVASGAAPFDLVVSNPPYVDPADAPGLAPEVREYEPEQALFAPEGDVDHWVRRLLTDSAGVLVPGGLLLVELGAGQGARALALAREAGFEARLHEDLAGIERVLEARRPG